MADFSKFKIGNTSYDVKDVLAGKSLSVSGKNLSLLKADGTAASTVTLPGGGSTIYTLSPIRYDNGYKFYGPSTSPIVGDFILFDNALTTANAITILIEQNKYYLELVDSYTNRTYRLYKWGQTDHSQSIQYNIINKFTTNCKILTKVTGVQSSYTELDIIDIIPVYRNSAANTPLSVTSTLTDGQANSGWYFIDFQGTITAGITIVDSSDVDITSTSTITVTRGKKLNKDELLTVISITTTSASARIKSIVIDYEHLGIPVTYKCNNSSSTLVCQGIFSYTPTANLGKSLGKWTIEQYTYNNAGGKTHIITCKPLD